MAAVSTDTPPKNSMFVMYPYRRQGVWMFDDPKAGIVQEPFVAGADLIIGRMVIGIPDAAQGFVLIFSPSPYSGYQFEFEKRRKEFGGFWYFSAKHGLEGWLCPALLKYFDDAPARLYAQVQGTSWGRIRE